MATLADLKARIILETDRDDLGAGGEAESALVNAVARAIEHVSDEAFWFNRQEAAVSTIAGTATIAVPAAIRMPDSISYLGAPLRKVALREIEARSETGIPSAWSPADGLVQLWPIPDGSYSLTVAGVAQIDAPTLDPQGTVWLDEAYDLIAARVRFLLYRDVFRDAEGAQFAQQAEDEALHRLRRETRRRGVTPLRSAGDEPWTARSTFNANTGI